ncbi:hypothetical protein BDZ91DRAFT_719634 [Kalaharituber pfeilii]|nr:hypothetical protein BDZ91DRAFT_719634 [Kalaharituber pfeilii]
MHPFQACIPLARYFCPHPAWFSHFRNYPYQSLAVFSCRTMTPAADDLHT